MSLMIGPAVQFSSVTQITSELWLEAAGLAR